MQLYGISFMHPYKQSGRWQGATFVQLTKHIEDGSFKLFKRPFPGFLTILTL